MKLAELTGKKILVVGMGSEGKATYRFLKKYTKKTIIDTADAKDGPDYLNRQKDYDLIIKSPGVPLGVIKIPYTTSTNIFFANFKGFTVAITGTKGKSTTTKLTYDILKKAGKSVSLLGNIGVPMLDALEKFNNPHGIAVCELSSYQLEGFEYAPGIAVITNIYDAHLPHHGDRANYIAAKFNIVARADSSSVYIYNPQFKELKQLAKRTQAKVVPIESNALAQPAHLPGKFNAANIRTAQTIAHQLKISDSVIKAAIDDYEPLPHRLQLIGTYRQIKFYDDATSTTPESTIAALETLAPVETLLVGGQDIGYDFSGLAKSVVAAKVRNLVLFPDSGLKIKQLLKAADTAQMQILETRSMEEAVDFAYKYTKPGGICLLSNAAPSFTIWKDYLDKANLFHKFVKQLAKK